MHVRQMQGRVPVPGLFSDEEYCADRERESSLVLLRVAAIKRNCGLAVETFPFALQKGEFEKEVGRGLLCSLSLHMFLS